MKKVKKYYPKVIEHFAIRAFPVGSRVLAYLKGDFYSGTVTERTLDERGTHVLIKTDQRVDSSLDALLDGFGIKAKAIDNPKLIYEYEREGLDKIFTQTYEREMTPKEKREEDNCPF